MTPQRGDFVRSFLRTFSLQGSWNYGTFVAAGLSHALLPLLARIHAGDPVSFRRSVRRHLETFNAHPYLAPLAVGALARLEHEGGEDDVIRRFRAALAGPLGAVGDRLVWAGWRPVCLLSAVVAHSLGLAPWMCVLVFLVPYNAGHLALRLWAFRRGWRDGLEGAQGLSSGTPGRVAGALGSAAAFLAGAAAVLLAGRLAAGADLPTAGAAVALLAAVAGGRDPGLAGRAAVALVAAAAIAGGVGL